MTTDIPARCVPARAVTTATSTGPRKAVIFPEVAKKPNIWVSRPGGASRDSSDRLAGWIGPRKNPTGRAKTQRSAEKPSPAQS